METLQRVQNMDKDNTLGIVRSLKTKKQAQHQNYYCTGRLYPFAHTLEKRTDAACLEYGGDLEGLLWKGFR